MQLDLFWKRLLAGTIPVHDSVLTGRVPVNNFMHQWCWQTQSGVWRTQEFFYWYCHPFLRREGEGLRPNLRVTLLKEDKVVGGFFWGRPKLRGIFLREDKIEGDFFEGGQNWGRLFLSMTTYWFLSLNGRVYNESIWEKPDYSDKSSLIRLNRIIRQILDSVFFF